MAPRKLRISLAKYKFIFDKVSSSRAVIVAQAQYSGCTITVIITIALSIRDAHSGCITSSNGKLFIMLLVITAILMRSTLSGEKYNNNIKNRTSTLLEHCVTRICRKFCCVQNLSKQWLAIKQSVLYFNPGGDFACERVRMLVGNSELSP